MRVAHEAVRPFDSRLRYESVAAPPAAVLALFTLVPRPFELLTVASWDAPGHRGPAAWTLVGLEQGGLAVVRANVEAGAGDGEVMSARWHPDAHLRCVGVTAVKTFREQLDVGDVVGSFSWLLRIEGEGELLLPTPEDGDATHIEAVCRRLQAVLGASRESGP